MKRLSLLNSALSQTKSQRRSLISKLSSSSVSDSSVSQQQQQQEDDSLAAPAYISNAQLEQIKHEENQKKMEQKKKRKRQLLEERGRNSTGHKKEEDEGRASKKRRIGSHNNISGESNVKFAGKRAATNNEASESDSDSDSDSSHIPSPLQVMKLLRQYKEPITLFAESPLERWSRLKFIEKKYVEMVNEQNTYQKHMREEEDKRRERELLRGGGFLGGMLQQKNSSGDAGREGNVGDGDASSQQQKTANSSQSATDNLTAVSSNGSGALSTWRQSKFKKKEEYVLYMMERLIDEWRIYLAQRPEHEQKKAAGKREYANWKQTIQYLDPLTAKLRAGHIDKDQLRFFAHIFSHVAEKEYVMANDQYLQLAIGNAPWPMGVESVGIHARSAREKISSRNVAHVLNDDTQRKYIQSVKRLITFAQKKYPTIPSKMVS